MLFWKELIYRGLQDDHWEWDWTTLGSLQSPNQKAKAQVLAKSEGVWAATDLFSAVEEVSLALGVPMKIVSEVQDGMRVKPGTLICQIQGQARAILALERVMLNLAAYSGGIATHTQKLVHTLESAWKKNKTAGHCPRVTSTRKIPPAYRDLAIHSVRTGGGVPHRITLSGGVLIKENHLAVARSMEHAISGVRAQAPHGLKIEIEVRNLAELERALKAQVDGVLLDNFTPTEVQKAVKKTQGVFVEVSGGITADSIGNYAIRGVDVISSGALTHWVKSLDLSLLVRS